MGMTVSRWAMWVQHFLAWVRGDFTKIVGKFEKAASQLEAHKTYLNLIADNQAQAARSLAAAAKVNYAEADKANKVAINFRTLVNPESEG